MDLENIIAEIKDKLLNGKIDEERKNDIVTYLKNGDLKLVTVVENLGDVLTNEQVTIRQHGLEYLSWTLTNIPVDLLNEKEISVITAFYCDCLKGHHSLIPAIILGFLYIVKMDKLSKETLILMLSKMFHHIVCQSQTINDRYNIFCIFEFLFENKLEYVKPMGPDFVFGLISYVEGETDPGNLLLLFQIYPKFLTHFPLGHLSEEMFEVLACYFPVDFSSAERNNVIITRDNLGHSLGNCLSSIASWADFCLPLIMEKLDSSLKTAKLDSYDVLKKCCALYTAEEFKKHLNELWKMIQKDLLPGNDESIRSAALLSLADVVVAVGRSEDQTTLHELLSDILASVKSLLVKVADSLFHPAMNILSAVCSKSKTATTIILTHLQPYCYPEFTIIVSERKILLSSFTPFLMYARDFGIAQLVNSNAYTSYVQIMEFFLSSSRHEHGDVRQVSLMGIQIIIDDLNDVQKESLYSVVLESIVSDSHLGARKECAEVLRKLALKYPEEVNLKITQPLINGDINVLTKALDCLAQIADLPSFSSAIVPKTLDMIRDSSHCNTALNSLLTMCKAGGDYESHFLKTLHKQLNVASDLIHWWLTGVTKPSVENVFNDVTVLKTVAEIVCSIIRMQDAEDQLSLLQQYVNIFVNGFNDSEDCTVPVLDSCSQAVQQTVILLEAVIAPMKKEAISRNADLEAKLVSLAYNPQEVIRTSAGRLLALFVNKLKESDGLSLSENIYKQLLGQQSTPNNLYAAQLMNWVVKGLVLRGIANLDEWTARWFELLAREDVGIVVAQGFSLVLEEDAYMHLRNSCNIRILYRQRLFLNFPKLVSILEVADVAVQSNYLLALSNLIQGVPKHVVALEMSSVVVLLVQSLLSDKQEVLYPALVIISQFLQDKEPVFSQHFNSFLPKLMDLATFKRSMKIRILALQSLFYYAFYPTSMLLPFKLQVLRNLESCLDDKKRLVRQEAVKARSRWFLVGAPGEDSIFSS